MPKTTRRVVLAGPPGCGKSTILRMLKNQHPHQSIAVGFIDEAATALMEDVPFLKSSVSALMFQGIVNATISRSDKLLCETLQGIENKDEIVIISDRCLVDTFIYSGGDLGKVGCYFSPPKYDVFIIMDGLYCGTAGNKHRLEATIEEYDEIAKKTVDVYCHYAMEHQIPVIRIPTTKTIDEKGRLVAEALNSFLQKEVFCL